MKRLSLVLVLLAFIGTVHALDLKVGANLGFSPLDTISEMGTYSNTTLGVDKYSIDMKDFNVGLFFDAEYFRFSLGYSTSVGDWTKKMTNTTLSNGMSTNMGGNIKKDLSLSLIGKYPIKLSDSASIWPGLGIAVNIPIYFGDTNHNVLTNKSPIFNAMTDVWLVGTVGSDIKLSKNLYLEPQVTVSYNLTPKPSTNAGPVYLYGASYSKEAYSEIKLSAYIGLAYKL